MKRLKFIKTPNFNSLMADESMKIVQPWSMAEWENRKIGWHAIPNLGADFSLKVSENITVNGNNVFNFTLDEYVKDQVQYARTLTESIKWLKNLVESVNPVLVKCSFNSNNSTFLVLNIEGYGLVDFPGL